MANAVKKMFGAKWFQRTSAVALVLVLLAVVVSIVLAFVAPANKTPTAQPQTSTEPTQGTPSATASGAPTAGGKCNVPAGDMSFEPKMPADLKWVADKGFTWPVSATVGPTKTEGPAGSCYARSPLGAALYVTNFFNRTLTGGTDEGWKARRAEMLAAGTTNVGFVVDYFDGDKATASVVLRTTAGQTVFKKVTLNLVWENDDWKGSEEGAPLPSSIGPEEFVPWRES